MSHLNAGLDGFKTENTLYVVQVVGLKLNTSEFREW
jgi:hypothetical protein